MLPEGDLFQSYRPDIAVACADFIYVLELTVCHETTLIHSHDYKKNKYKDIGRYGSTVASNWKIVPHFIEVSTLGFIADISNFTKALKILMMPKALYCHCCFKILF